MTKEDIFQESRKQDSNSNSVFMNDNRYSSETFQGILPDTGAAGVSTAGEPQFRALQRQDPSIKLDTSTAGQQRIRFGKGEAVSKGTATVLTPLGPITFHVIPANTPFLLCLQDMDRIGVKLDNIENMLVKGELKIPVTRKWGHPWMTLRGQEQTLAHCHLTETELRRIHRRFGHPSVRRLYEILQRSGNAVEFKALKHLTKYCH